jgi:peptidoglycan/LPS O-acetylase OafA/YrhL
LWVLGYQYNWTRLDGSDSPLFSHMWSLSVEEQFYIIWPGVLMLAWRRWGTTGAGWACLVGAAALMGWREVVNAMGFEEWAKYGTDTSAAGLLLGAAIVCLKPRMPALLGWAGLPLVLIPALASAHWEVQGRTVAALGAACIMTAPPSLFYWRPLRGLGIISYGVYLWHYPLQRFMAQLGMPAIPFAVAILVALGSYHWLEEPIHRRVRRASDQMPIATWRIRRPFAGRGLEVYLPHWMRSRTRAGHQAVGWQSEG